jgi:predicted CXXCH cytochrome family protein
MRRREILRAPGAWSLAAAILLLAPAPAASAQQSVRDSVHNLSASGPGAVRASTEQEICIFCHAPHKTSGMRPLWNRRDSTASYRIYQSSTLDAKPGQPTGSSKFCLSCHDGTIALGAVLSRPAEIRMAGSSTLPAGMANLGTDLSDDHPVSFAYTTTLAEADRQLVSPVALPPEIKLDRAQQLQCTSCHNAHDNRFGDFLVRSDRNGALCTACHRMDGWTGSPHQASGASVAGHQTAGWPYPTVAENACRSCHRSHGARGKERLHIFEREEDNCLSCHDGRVTRKNIQAELNKLSAHNPRSYLGLHDPTEGQPAGKPHVECADCHNPHAVRPATTTLGYVPIGATLAKVPGTDIGGAPVQEARFEYEVCIRCHGDTAMPISGAIARVDRTNNLRLKIATTNPSYHPVAGPVTSMDTVSLVADFPRGSRLRCTDCHNSDQSPRAGGTGADGPHGSLHEFLLVRRYSTADNTPESESAYALCYQCHRRSSILSDESFSGHRRHIVDQNTPCSVCHDAHGVRPVGATLTDQTHLINFDTTVVFNEPSTNRLEFRDLGRFRGSCTLLCHSHNHVDATYPED